jgi:hypothetical protein
MKHKKITALLLAALLSATVFVGCNDNNGNTTETTANTANTTNATIIGKGDTTFSFSVTFADGTTKAWTVSTDKTTVGDALEKVGLVKGKTGQYGLEIEEVDGVRAVYDTDNAYWAFHINGEYATTGVSSTSIDTGNAYSLVHTKA